MSRTPRVLLALPGFARGSTFVETDRALLAQHYPVTVLYQEAGDRLFPLRVGKYLRRTDVAVAWFADAHAYWAVRVGRCLGKPVVVIPGQYEFVVAPEGPYGLRLESEQRWRQARFAVSRAAQVLAVSEFHRSLIAEAQTRPAPLQVVYHGFEVGLSAATPCREKSPAVLTTAHLQSPSRVWHKGLETFARAAAQLPGVRFVLIGGYEPDIAAHLQTLADQRLELTGALPPPQVAERMAQAKVYAQLSATETFGCALAEAMLCECVPVVTSRGSLPEVAGDVGYYVEYGDVEGTVAAIEQALVSDRGPAARERIATLFPLEKREQGLVEAIESVVRR